METIHQTQVGYPCGEVFESLVLSTPAPLEEVVVNVDKIRILAASMLLTLIIAGFLAAYAFRSRSNVKTVTVTVTSNLPPSNNTGGGELSLGTGVSRFLSYDQLASYLEASRVINLAAGLSRPMILGGVGLEIKATPTVTSAAPSHSETNVQVEGVDEADIAKTDGHYIYVASGNKVWFVEAYPPSPVKLNVERVLVLSSYTRVDGLFVSQGRLIVLAEKGFRIMPLIRLGSTPFKATLSYEAPSTHILVYNVSTADLLYNVSVSGRYVASRLAGNALYVVTSQPVAGVNGSLSLPLVDGEALKPGNIYYFPEQMGLMYTIVTGLNITDGSHKAEALLTSYAGRIYMTQRNLYVVSSGFMNFTDVMLRINNVVRKTNASGINAWKALEIVAGLERALSSSRSYDKTAVYRFSLKGLSAVPEASTVLEGRILDQFSVDEYEGYLRVAVTMGWGRNTTNALYVLNASDLSVAGKLSGLAEGERVYAARYVGKLCFLVTYRQVDPLFAIDLSSPGKPRVLGYVKMPGFSEYLHPYGDRFLIGVGLTDDHRVKMAVFDVSDPAKPVVIGEVETNYSYTPIQWDHKAFTINNDEGYVLIPVAWPRTRMAASSLPAGGVMVVRIDNATGRITMAGVLDHRDALRGMYIGDVIYTVSYRMVKAFQYPGLREIGEAALYSG